MTQSATGHTSLKDSRKAGHELGERIRADLGGEPPDALIVFSSARHDFAKLLRAIVAASGAKALVGSSSAGEFTANSYDEGAVSAVGLRSDTMRFHGAIGRGLRADRSSAAQQITANFEGLKSNDLPHRAALILTDALAGHADDFVEKLTTLTAGRYQLFGGGAGDDAKFTRTHVFFNEEAVPDAAVALEILSEKPIGIGVRHSWEPATPPFRVTESDGMRLISLNNVPAADVFAEFAESSGQIFHRQDPIPFFLHNTIGVATPAGYRLRVPLAVNNDGSIQCAADVATGSLVHIMSPAGGSAMAATVSALEQIQNEEPEVALFFDCVATRLRMGREFGFELKAVKEALRGAQYAGCNTYGQIARAEGQFSGFHNCTAVVAVVPK
ncbi:MAG TPA: FIST N-terminal domain-containing protein [Methylomirabilota bacterium]|nr:FIST N-terminal domain-containing protein [Methylomirabilota bacterium]